MVKKSTTRLLGMKEIAEYTGRSPKIVIKWSENDNFPAVKIDGQWESNTDLIDGYQLRRIERAVQSQTVKRHDKKTGDNDE